MSSETPQNQVKLKKYKESTKLAVIVFSIIVSMLLSFMLLSPVIRAF